MRSIATAAVTIAALAGLTACNSSAAGQTPSAKEQVQAIAAAVDGVTVNKVYTAKTDPNDLMGRPGGYTSLATCADSKVKLESAGHQDWACSMEVFESEADAKDRAAYIRKVVDAMPLLGTEYHFIDGSTLLRVAGDVPPKRADAYAAAIDAKAIK